MVRAAFATAFEYARAGRPTPELAALLAKATQKPGAIVEYAEAHLPWFPTMVRQVDGCVAKFR